MARRRRRRRSARSPSARRPSASRSPAARPPSADGETFLFRFEPIAASRPRVSRWRAYYKGPYAKFREVAAEKIPEILRDHGGFSGPLRIKITVAATRPKSTSQKYPRPDWDNYAKAICDALNNRMYIDDRHIVDGRLVKRWAKPGKPGWFKITVWPAD